MKNAQEYSKRIKQLYSKLKKAGGKATLEVADDPMHVLLLGILSNYTSEQRAAAALRKILDAAVDTNELRVTPVADMVIAMGLDVPQGRRAAGEIMQVLNSIFNALHHLDLSFLKSQSKKAVAAFLLGLDGITPHAAAFFRSRYLNQSDIPLDENMMSHLQRGKCLPNDIMAEEAHRFVSGIFGVRESANFYAAFKKFASAHAPRKPSRRAARSATASENFSDSVDSGEEPAIDASHKPNAGKSRAASKPRKSRPARSVTTPASRSAGRAKATSSKRKKSRARS